MKIHTIDTNARDSELRFYLDEIVVDVVRKNIKNVHLSVYPPAGNVRISAPLRMNLDTIRGFASSKLDWIKKQQQKIRSQTRESPRSYLDRESHYLWGKGYLLNLIEIDAPPQIELRQDSIVLHVRPSTDIATKRALVDEFYRQQIEAALPPLIVKWEKVMGVRVTSFTVRKMKTKWGSCTPALQTIRFNLELAKKPAECLEYVVVHELVHLLEPSHNRRFIAFMDSFMPKWRFVQAELNRLPISVEN
ncbi:M48 family metallopeptidase [Chamaesiphon minutus]|uniref:Putative metal-dependent hydrolase n=1 Tax=Chamaesiphon minutus (strain ATCC 27169 / PCC 6605) TaxID=1173020 RepID=K9UPX8_CHAP6|nr:SprT family zinc-dependent metalloprotease [Chamaesiphon minutus]AFY96491.1 putative metal-dependent hydrolase [Chamaesiphon minutus PCC 6605]